MVAITSNELNYLIFRYLHESGFGHSAFTLGYEAGLVKTTIDSNLVPPGALVTFIHKGIQYLELEANSVADDLDSDEDFQFIHPLDLITKDVGELQKIIKEKKAALRKNQSKGREKDNTENARDHGHGKATEKGKHLARKEREREKHRDKVKIEQEKKKQKVIEKEKPSEDVHTNGAKDEINGRLKHGTEGAVALPPSPPAAQRLSRSKLAARFPDQGPEPMDVLASLPDGPREILDSDVTALRGHTAEVFGCAWNPAGPFLASGSGDSTARIWTIDRTSSPSKQNGVSSVILSHVKGKTNDLNKDVTTLDWNTEGTFLATGCYDGQARIWSREGDLIGTLDKHKGPIFSLKWNKKGDYLLSGSVDKSAIVWDAKTSVCKQQFNFHTAPTLDVDWRDNVSFATCSADGIIHVCKVGEIRQVRSFKAHQGEVNAIKWDPSGAILASCSDDTTAKIWSLKQETCLLDFKGHTKEIYTIKWSPTGDGTNNPNQKLLLASASFDSTVKLWDVDVGRFHSSLNGHKEPVYSIAFSPNGEYLASGSIDKCMNIWSVKDNKIVKTLTGKAGIFEVCWNKEGNKLAVCFNNNEVSVLDFRM